MKIEHILAYPDVSLLYMERLVNDGSPSKFSFVNTTSRETSPLHAESFHLCATPCDNSRIVSFGTSSLAFFNSNYLIVHPDWKTKNPFFPVIDTDIRVAPTSSSRTVKLLDEDVYVKLFYPGVLGRITRELGVEHILSGIDITNVLSKLIDDNLLPRTFAFLPERCGKVLRHAHGDVGYIVRESTPIGMQCNQIHALLPAFSLFSTDRQSDDIPIIIQMLNQKQNKVDFLLEQLIYPLIDCYFSCIFCGGIQPELHAQNFLVGIDSNCNIVSIVLRDLDSADKDLEIMSRLGLPITLKSKPYKCINTQQENYRIKHSFMYDHKLGEYFFDELLKCVHKHGIVQADMIQTQIQAYVRYKYGGLLTDFFPDNQCWYKFQNVLIDRSQSSRPYICLPNPKYR